MLENVYLAIKQYYFVNQSSVYVMLDKTYFTGYKKELSI